MHSHLKSIDRFKYSKNYYISKVALQKSAETDVTTTTIKIKIKVTLTYGTNISQFL